MGDVIAEMSDASTDIEDMTLKRSVQFLEPSQETPQKPACNVQKPNRNAVVTLSSTIPTREREMNSVSAMPRTSSAPSGVMDPISSFIHSSSAPSVCAPFEHPTWMNSVSFVGVAGLLQRRKAGSRVGVGPIQRKQQIQTI